jgi:hypothetical protein
MRSVDPLIEHAGTITTASRRPATNLRLTLWLLALFATVFVVSRVAVPIAVRDYQTWKLEVPGVTGAFLAAARWLSSTLVAGAMGLLAIGLPVAFARVAWVPGLPDRFAYRRLLAIHLVTCALLAYLLIASVCLFLPYVRAVRSASS